MRCLAHLFLILFVVTLASAKTSAESTGNLLSNDFTDGTWTTNIQSYHGSNTIAGVDGQYVESKITLSDHMNSMDIENVYQSDLTADIWFWNNESQSVTISQTITDSNGKEYSNNTVVSGTCATNCSYFTAPTNSILITDVASNYDIVSRFSFTVPNQSSGHYGADLRNPSLILYFEPFKMDVKTPDDVDIWLDDFEKKYEAEFKDETFTFTDVFKEEDKMNDYYLFENDMYLYMTPEEEVKDEPVEDIMTGDVEEYIEEFQEETADEMEENFFSDEPVTQPAGEPQPVPSVSMMADIEKKDQFTITLMIKDQPILQDVSFYQPVNIYVNQLSLSDNRDIYNDVVYIANDPLTIQIDKQRENQEQQYKLQKKLESMTWKN